MQEKRKRAAATASRNAREHFPLFVTDAEIAKRIGIPEREKDLIKLLERRGFPLQEPLFGNLRYWPAVRQWLDKRYMLDFSYIPQGSCEEDENW